MRRVVYSLCLLWITNAWAQSAAADFLRHLREIRTMKAHYTQVVSSTAQELSRSSGDMALLRPRQFRWETLKPVPQLIVADGQKIWIYDIDLEQVTVRKQRHDLHTGIGLLLYADEAQIARAFAVSMQSKADEVAFVLRAKSTQAQLQRLVFRFKANQLFGMELFDTLNQHTVVQFQHSVTNQVLPSSLFKFTPPKGVDVLDEGDTRA